MLNKMNELPNLISLQRVSL